MMAILVWWFALPTVLRRLLGAFLLAASLIAAASFALHRARSAGYDAGHKAGADSAWLADTRKAQVVLDSLEHRADSLVTKAKQADSLITVQARTVIRTFGTTPSVRLVPNVAAVPTVPLVSVFVESDSASYPTHPRLAQLLVWQDSVIHLELVPLIARQQTVIAQLDTAVVAEHAARLGADSLSAQWRLRALSNVAPAAHGMSWQGKALHALAWAGVTLIVANQIHHR